MGVKGGHAVLEDRVECGGLVGSASDREDGNDTPGTTSSVPRHHGRECSAKTDKRKKDRKKEKETEKQV